MSLEFHNAFILHRRPYSETSQIIDLFCQDIGKVSVIFKGGRSSTRMKRGLPQPFTLLQVSYFGRNNLKTLRSIETQTQGIPLSGNKIYSAIYLNELLYRLLQGEFACEGLFESYKETLLNIARVTDPQIALRNFELTLLETLGYGVNFCDDVYRNQLINKNLQYIYLHQHGFSSQNIVEKTDDSYSGDDILSFGKRDFSNSSTRQSAKRFCRKALAHLLGNKPLQSRKLFVMNNL